LVIDGSAEKNCDVLCHRQKSEDIRILPAGLGKDDPNPE